MEFLNKSQKIIFILIGALMIIFIGYYIIKKTEYYNYNELEVLEESDNSNNEEEIINREIIVHITGEVINEGIIKVEENSRIADVIEKAGGVTDEADLSVVNLAYLVRDGQKINIPNKNDNEEENVREYLTENAGPNIVENDIKDENKININTATQTELEVLNGIGPSTALKIINYRNENGKFKKIEDIKEVPGIGESKFEGIKENICI